MCAAQNQEQSHNLRMGLATTYVAFIVWLCSFFVSFVYQFGNSALLFGGLLGGEDMDGWGGNRLSMKLFLEMTSFFSFFFGCFLMNWLQCLVPGWFPRLDVCA